MLIGIASTYYHRHGGVVPSLERRFGDGFCARGAEVTYVDPMACSYELSSGRAVIRHAGRPLLLDGLLIRRAAHHWNAVKTLVLMAHEAGTACVDRPETFLGTLSGKFQAQLRRYRLGHCETPRSFLYFGPDSLANDPPPPRAYPLLRKPLRGSLGEGIVRIPNPRALDELARTYDFRAPLMLQSEVDGVEYRAIMLRQRCLGVVRKRPGAGGLGNFAQGAEFVRADADEAAEMAAVGRAVMADAPYDFAALDAIRTPGGAYAVLECNRNPHFKGFEAALPEVDVVSEVVDYVLAACG